MGVLRDYPDKALSCLLDINIEMACYRSDEANLITFLGGFNQMFLIYNMLTIVVTLMLESHVEGEVKPEDFDFELDTALEKSSGHFGMVAYFVSLALAAVIYVLLARFLNTWKKNRDMAEDYSRKNVGVAYSGRHLVNLC